MLLLYVKPATRYFEAWQLSRDTQAEVRELRTDNKALHERSRELKRSSRVELEARRLGMARPGERVYVVRGLPQLTGMHPYAANLGAWRVLQRLSDRRPRLGGGLGRVQASRSDPGHKRMLGRVVTAVEDELRKRLGSRFTSVSSSACIASGATSCATSAWRRCRRALT